MHYIVDGQHTTVEGKMAIMPSRDFHNFAGLVENTEVPLP